MDVKVTSFKHCDLVKVTGRIDSDSVPILRETLNSLTNQEKLNIVLDMTDVNFVSSSGWWVLIDTQKTCKRGGRGELVLACIAERIKRSLDLVGMSEYFRTYDDITEAVGEI